jgi:DNA (cytosine-5)-methyltransferase 1
MTENEILEKAYKKAEQIVKKKQFDKFSEIIRKDTDLLIEKIEQNKSIVSALVTSLVKKIIDPKQDIRLHRTDFENGYSARSLDTKFTSPFFKNHFPKYANKESSFLTLATRERIKWTKKDGNALKIRNKALKNSFLNIFDQIEVYKVSAEDYLNYLFAQMIELSSQDEIILDKVDKEFQKIGTLNINIILEMLQKHFAVKLSSRLPVIAIYSIYQILIPILKRYENKKLVSLQVHTSSDKHGFGDIEIYTKTNKPFEIVEIKHNIPLDKYLIFDIVKKTENTPIDRYYILTTYKAGFENEETEKSVNEFIMQIKQLKGIDIIANGIITTLKYYLRFIDDYKQFVKTYTDNLIKDTKNSTEVKSFHIEKWTEILKEYGLKK